MAGASPRVHCCTVGHASESSEGETSDPNCLVEGNAEALTAIGLSFAASGAVQPGPSDSTRAAQQTLLRTHSRGRAWGRRRYARAADSGVAYRKIVYIPRAQPVLGVLPNEVP